MVNVMAERAGLTKVDARKALDAFVGTTIETLKNDENVSIAGLGTFTMVKRAARKGRNPITGKEIMIAEKNVLKFKPSSCFKNK